MSSHHNATPIPNETIYTIDDVRRVLREADGPLRTAEIAERLGCASSTVSERLNSDEARETPRVCRLAVQNEEGFGASAWILAEDVPLDFE